MRRTPGAPQQRYRRLNGNDEKKGKKPPGAPQQKYRHLDDNDDDGTDDDEEDLTIQPKEMAFHGNLHDYDSDSAFDDEEQWVGNLNNRVSRLEYMLEMMNEKMERDFMEIQRMMMKRGKKSSSARRGSRYSSKDKAKIRAALKFLERELLG